MKWLKKENAYVLYKIRFVFVSISFICVHLIDRKPDQLKKKQTKTNTS